MRRFQQLILSSFAVLAISFSVAPLALAGSPSVIGDACDGSSSVICQQTKDADTKTNDFIENLINTLLFVVGTIAVVMIIIGGIRYVTSNGDSGQITAAKNTILYSVIGLILAMMSWGIARFVVDQF